MRIVIDRCCMDGEELRAFLAMSRNNIAVLTDYAAMEAFKGDTLANIQSSWRVLGDFPGQVIALKATREVARLAPEAVGIANRMIAKAETKAIARFPDLLARAAVGQAGLTGQLLQRGRWAQDHLDGMLSRSGHMKESIAELGSVFTQGELKRMRRREPWSEEIADKFIDLVFSEAKLAFAHHPDKPDWPSSKHIANHFLFRHTVAYLLYVMEFLLCGAEDRKPALVRNDAIDVIYATFATYYNGFMSDDGMASRTHQIARFVLAQMGARIPENYMDRYALEIASFRNAQQPGRQLRDG